MMDASTVIYNNSLQSDAIAEEEREQTGRVLCHQTAGSSSRRCLSGTIDFPADILDLNGSREKKKLLTIAFAGHVKVLRRGGLQKGNK